MNAQYLMVGRAFSYRSSSISRGPITISNAGLTESDVIPVLNKEAFRTWQFMRPPRELGGDRNDVSAFRVYSTVCLHL
jgi:rieske iron-sulfur protein